MKTLESPAAPPGGDGRRLSYSFSPPDLENKLLTQTSALLKPSSFSLSPQSVLCPSLQLSGLTSTTSTLLSSTLPSSSSLLSSSTLPSSSSLLSSSTLPFSSSLVSTQNKLLNASPSLLSAPDSTSLTGNTLLNRLVCSVDLKEEGGDAPEAVCCVGEDITMHDSEEDVDTSDKSITFDEEEEVQEEEDREKTEPLKREEFPDLKRDQKDKEEKIVDMKYFLLNLVCGSLVSKSKSPGESGWRRKKSIWTKITNLSKDISEHDPQFLLKVAVYTRQELNIRITANFLLALAASLPSTKCHVRRYFCAAVQLPSDWLEVVRIYSTCFSEKLPMCLKKGLTDKFKQFSEYQLAKYNTRKHRCKHNCKKAKGKTPTEEQLKKWAGLVRSEPAMIRKMCMGDTIKTKKKKGDKKKVVDKKQSEFSLKKMIRRLHIKDPAEHVMSILGSKYPSDAKAFIRSGIKGTWDRDRAGTRMKLKEPETWERLLSQEGNKAKTWEKLIDNNSLPFMAMLRNLRNMIVTGISEAHHQKILSKLTNKKAVIQSRQFPIRFLAAYKVIMELQALASTPGKTGPTLTDILRDILKKIPQSQRFSNQDWDKTPKSRLRATLAMPLVYRLYKTKRAHLTAGKKGYSVELLRRYRDALEKAVQISSRYNIPPLPGRTVVLLDWSLGLKKTAQDFCLPPEQEENQENKEEKEDEEEEATHKRKKKKCLQDDPLAPTPSELGALLSLMIGSSAEDFTLVLTQYQRWEVVKLQSDVLLENVRTVTKKLKHLNSESESEEEKKKAKGFWFLNEGKVDNIIVVSDSFLCRKIEWAVRSYRNDVNNKALFVEVQLNTEKAEISKDRNHVHLAGFSEQMLRFIAERGSSRLLDHVEHLDKVYNVPPPEGAKEPLSDSTLVSLPATPNMRWQSVRVFISSTFRDMHSERDILVRSVFPELRRRAAPHCLYLQEVELRWGVTEEEQGRMAELCLNEVCRSQMMVVLLGERYGLVPPKPELPERSQYDWLSSAPDDLSITEMEICQFEALYPETQMLCYFRDPNVSNSVPVAWKADFAPESRKAQSKMAELKTWLRENEAKVTDYSGEWGGVVDGKPYLKNLETFRKAVLEDLWTAVKEQFIESTDESTEEKEVSEQEVHQESLWRQFCGRSKLLSAAMSLVEQAQTKGGVLVVEAGPGEGKTVFMAALGHALTTSKRHANYDVISYSAAASQSARSLENLLRFLNGTLRRIRKNEDESASHQSYQELLSEFYSVLSKSDKSSPLVILVDGVDLFQDGKGRIVSDWIPQHIPQGVCLVVSVPTSSSLIQSLSKKKSTLLFSLAQLTLADRREIVQKRLDSFGKKLSDSAFNNQVQTLTMKKGAVSPLYLHLACEDLRNYASFDKLKESLEALPQSLHQLVQFSLDRLCSENRHISGFRWALAVLTVSSTGLKERDLLAVLNTCSYLFAPEAVLTWDVTLDVSRTPRRIVPMADFTRIVHSLQSLIGPSNCADTNDLLVLSNPELKRAFEEFFLPTEEDRSRACLLLAAHLWTSADPMGTDTFLHCEATSLMQLPSALIGSKQRDQLQSLFSSYFFLFANVRCGFEHYLMNIYNNFTLFAGADEHVLDCWSFLRRHSSLLSSWPGLFVQQALNEPPQSSAHIWAQGMQGEFSIIKLLNSIHTQGQSEEVCSFPSEPSCVVLSPNGSTAVVGTLRGTLHFVDFYSKKVERSLVSSCDGVSSCVFIKDGSLTTTSFDGKIEMWDVENGCRTALVTGHNNAITGSDVSTDKKHLATVSLDSMLKVWSTSKVEQVASLFGPCPMNCVTFDPEGHVLAAGCWNGKVIVWNWLQNKTIAFLEGHSRSVHSVAFSSSSLLCSGSVSGKVRVWSVSSASCVGCFQAHSGSTEALGFIDNGKKLLTAGADHLIQLWSDGLGHLVTTLQSEKSAADSEPPVKKRRAPPVDPALCVAVTGETVAVGTRDGLHLYSLDLQCLGEKIWFSEDASPVRSLLWISVNSDMDVDMDCDNVSNAGSDRPKSDSDSDSDESKSNSGSDGSKSDAGSNRSKSDAGSKRSKSDAGSKRSKSDAGSDGSKSDSGADQSKSDSKTKSEPEVLILGRQSGKVEVWRKADKEQGFLGGLVKVTVLDSHRDAVLALAQNHTYVASASEDGTVALWLLSEILDGGAPHSVLRGHSGAVTCLTFSPEGDFLLSGGKDQTLTMWEVTSTPVLSETLHHCHRDWITGCVWTSGKDNCIATSSNDGRICFWDFATKKSAKEICWKAPLTSLCCQGTFILACSSDGELHVWNRDSGAEVCHISAHQQPIHHLALTTDAKEPNPEDLTVVTASEDGTAKVWKPLQVEHCGTLLGHTGGVRAVALRTTGRLSLSVSEDGSLRSWFRTRVYHPIRKGAVTALCHKDSLVVAGFESGLLEFWINNCVVGQKQVSKAGVSALCSMPDGQIAVGYKEPHVDVFKVVITPHSTVSLTKVASHEVKKPVMRLTFCSVLLAVTIDTCISPVVHLGEDHDWTHTMNEWQKSTRFLDWVCNDDKSLWMAGEDESGDVILAFAFTLGEKYHMHTSFGSLHMNPEGLKKLRGDLVTAVTMNNDLIVCGDVKGSMWFHHLRDSSQWSSRKPVHTDRITALRLTKNTIISASLDKAVKIWDRETKKQLGMFVCQAPVLLLEICSEDGSKLVCGDQMGNVYFLSWSQ